MKPLIQFLLLTTLVAFQSTWAQNINYFGVAFSPYVKNGPPYPYWNSYSLSDIKQMLRIILTYHNAVSTYSMGVASYNNGQPWDQCDSNCLISRAAAQINQEYGVVVLSVSQGIFQNDDDSLMNREIQNAFSAAADANGIWPGTVWGLTFTNEYVTSNQNGQRVLQMIQSNKDRAHQMGLRVGTRINNCGEIWGGANQQILIQIAQASDFIMCNLYPPNGASNPAQAIQQISDSYYSARDGFWRYNNQLEVQIGETGWASEGPTFNNAVNTVENMNQFWNGMKSWAQNNAVHVQMFEAFNEPWKGTGENQWGWWYLPNNNQNVYIEKATGKVYQ